jgi:hypothetical protein
VTFKKEELVMLEKLAIRKFIKENPKINFSNKEVADIEEKFSKALKLLRTLGLVKVYDLTKEGDLLFSYKSAADPGPSTVQCRVFFEALDEDEDVDVDNYDNIHNIVIEVRTSIDPRTSRSKRENYYGTISIPLEFGGPSVSDYAANYIGFVCDILTAFRCGFGYLE